MPEYKSTINLIPYGLPQFLDFQSGPEKIRRIQGRFGEEITTESDGKKAKENIKLIELFTDPDDEERLLRMDKYVSDNKKVVFPNDDSYIIQPEKHLEPWLNKWVPIPFLRESGDTYEDGSPKFRTGPTNWARAYLTRVPSATDPDVMDWRLVLAFDMQVEEREGDVHAALSPDDVTARASCSLAWQNRDNSWFLNEGWVSGWLESLWNEYFYDKENEKKHPRTPNGQKAQVGFFASYSVYLKVLQQIIGDRGVRILNLAGGQDQAADPNASDTVDVDLILDIGNSRSTGILVENILGKNTDLNDSYLLSLRDLSHPENFYTDPFETRVEFSKADFGSSAFSKRSGRRTNAFAWPSPVRTGAEATKLTNMAATGGGSTGMTSPKRYLWDQDQSPNLWFFNKANSEREELVSSNPICRYLNNSGTLVSSIRELKAAANGTGEAGFVAKMFAATYPECKGQEPFPANQPRFSRSSMMMFLLMELIQQALITINSPARRYSREYHDRPRRLRSIIFTVPPGMPFAEQRIYRKWAHAAVNLLWDALGWKKNFYIDPQRAKARKADSTAPVSRDYRINPEIRSRWDEATCTQLVYLYNEINQNFQGDAHLFFEIMGRKRDVPNESKPRETEVKPTLRVATIDMGGGTTDLSVITYVLANDKSSTNRIWPKQEIRDGANLGGDDVLRAIITEGIFPLIVRKLVEMGAGTGNANRIMEAMFGKKSDKISVQNQRIQFLRLVGMPMAYALLDEYEKLHSVDQASELSVSLRELFAFNDEDNSELAKFINESISFFNEEISRISGVKFNLLDLDLTMPASELDKIIGNNVRSVLNHMGEIINAYDCDVLLLSGRPSCWNAVTRQVFGMLPVAPDRVIPMRDYQVGSWYRFADAQGRINDPKTTVVMGAILCTLAENSIEGFVFDSSKLQLKSTARFIGQLDTQGTLPTEMVWFPNSNPDKKKGESEFVKIVDFSSPITVGFRQIDAGRWSASRGWRLEFASEEAQRKAQGHTPYKVKVEFVQPEQDEDLDFVPEISRDIRAKLDEPQIDYVDPEAVQGRFQSGGNEELVPIGGKPVRIKLCTLKKEEEDGCWMDTGELFK